MRIEASIVSIIARITATNTMKIMEKRGMLKGLCVNEIIERYEEIRFTAIIEGAKTAAAIINEMKYLPQYPILLELTKASALEELENQQIM